MKQRITSDFSLCKFALSLLTIIVLLTSSLAPSLNILTDDNSIVYADSNKEDRPKDGESVNVEDTNSYYSPAQYQQAVIEANKAKDNRQPIPPTIQEIIDAGKADGSIKSENGRYKFTSQTKNLGNVSNVKSDAMWTAYAQYIMGYGISPSNKLTSVFSKVLNFVNGKDSKGTEFENRVGSQVKTGSTKVEFQLSDLSTTASHFDGMKTKGGSWLSRRLASTIGTFVNYHYWETSDGPDEIKPSIGEKITAWTSMFLNAIAGVLDGMTTAISKVLFAFDPYSWMGWGDSSSDGTKSKNVIVRTISTFLQSFGISKAVIKTIINLMITVLAGTLCILLLLGVRKGNLKSAGRTLKNIGLRFILLLVFFPIMASATHNLSESISETLGKTKFSGASSEVIKHVLLDVEDWASSQNLSPTALNPANGIPDSGADNNYTDSDFAPSKKRGLIYEINKRSQETLDNSNSDSSKRGNGMTHKTANDLLEAWANGDTFTVKSYVASVERNERKPKVAAFHAGGSIKTPDFGSVPTLEYNDKTYLIASHLSSYIWSLVDFRTDNDSENSGYTINNKHKATVMNNNGKQKNEDIHYQENKPYGVDGGQSFSTQSVVLLLQTSFSPNGEAVFRSLNISPSGQSKTQQLSSSPIKWRSVTMPYDNALGKVAGYLYLFAFLLCSCLISFAVLCGLFYSGFFQSVVKFFRESFKFLFTGNYASAVSSVCYYLAIMVIGLLGLNLSAIVVNLVMTLSGTFAGLIPSSVPTSMVDIISSVVGIALSLWLAGIKLPFSISMKDSPIAAMLYMPLEVAERASKAIMKHSAVHNRLGSGSFGSYQGASSRGESSYAHKANANNDGFNNSLQDKINDANSNANMNGNASANGANASDKLNKSSLADKVKFGNNANSGVGLSGDLNNASDNIGNRFNRDEDKLHNGLDNINTSEGNVDNGAEKAPEDKFKSDGMSVVSLGNGGDKFGTGDETGKKSLTPLEEADIDIMNRDKTAQFKETTSEEAEKLASSLSDETMELLSEANNNAEAEKILMDDPNGSYVASQNNIAKQSIYDEEENPDKFFLDDVNDENGAIVGYAFNKDKFNEALRQTDEEIEKEADGDKDKKNELIEQRTLARKVFQEGTNGIYDEMNTDKGKILSSDEYKEKIARGLVSGTGTRSYLRNAKDEAQQLPRYIRNSGYMNAIVTSANGVKELVKGDAKAFTSALSEAKQSVAQQHSENKVKKQASKQQKARDNEQYHKDKAQKQREKSEKLAMAQQQRIAEVNRLKSKGKLNIYEEAKLHKMQDELNSAQKSINRMNRRANLNDNLSNRNVKQQAKSSRKIVETTERQADREQRYTEQQAVNQQRSQARRAMMNDIQSLEKELNIKDSERLNVDKRVSDKKTKQYHNELLMKRRKQRLEKDKKQ